MNNYIAYYRVSTHKQNLGLDVQQKSVYDFIISNSDNVLLREYSEKESGKNSQRTELLKAINDCRKNNATLVISKLDRLSRQVSFIFMLKDSGINFMALDIPNFNTITLGIYATVAQNERELISNRTKEALAVKKRDGIKLGAPNASFTPIQINNAAKVRKEIALNNVNNKRAKLMIESLLKETSNCAKIARILNEHGFTTSRDRKFDSKAVKRIIERYSLL